jgi:hypothetical protein
MYRARKRGLILLADGWLNGYYLAVDSCWERLALMICSIGA